MSTKQDTSSSDPKSPKDIIKDYLDSRAASDPLFAVSYAKPKKNIDECFNYILSEARKRGSQVCMSDEEVFGLAVHYYDEDDIKVGPALAAKVSTTTVTTKSDTPKVKLTEKEKATAKAEARRLYQQECIAELEAANRAAKKKQRPAPTMAQTPSLFDEF